MNPPFPFAGEILSLANAVVWTAAVLLFRVSGFTVGPISLNLFKGVLGTVLFAATLVFWGGFRPPGTNWTDVLQIAGSGVIGIAVADTLFFRSLNLLGAARAAIVDCLYSPGIILFAYFLLGEKLTPLASIGAALIVGGVLLSSLDAVEKEITPADFWKGTLLGALSMMLMGISIVAIKPILGQYPTLWSATLRMGGGTVGLAIFTLFRRDRKEIWSVFRPQPSWKVVFPGCFLGGYIGFLVWMGGFKFAQANVAALLTQLSSFFVMALAVLVLKERLTTWKILALALALGGTVLVLN
jgi:drug/metabolite transporter (DMT)-like permease